jgi:arylsulfate sulfotransferase
MRLVSKCDLRWIIYFFIFLPSFLAGCSPPDVPVEISLRPASSLVFSGQTDSIAATDSLGDSDLVWTVAGSDANSPSAAIDASGTFTAPPVSQDANFTVKAASRKDPARSASITLTVMPSGQVAVTSNPQVALYTLTLPAGATARIEFGMDTIYGKETWSQAPPAAGGSVSLFVAGMLASTTYHLRAAVVAADGTQSLDADHTFTTAALPNAEAPAVTVSITPGAAPQPGIEILDLINGAPPLRPLAAYDLSGNLIWSYPAAGSSSDIIQGVHLLPNGHFLMALAPGSSGPLSGSPVVPGTIYVLREIDLAGNTVREESLDALNASLAAAGYNITALTFHHDVIALPNGHWIGLVNMFQPCAGRPECAANPNILGDLLVDLAPQPDGTFLPVWVWNSFDHLDVTRVPVSVADWTHSNAIVYSPDDGNLLLSMRNQSWILKIDYNNGQGLGNIIWRLGYQGDFVLLGGTDPTDWFYDQHGPAFASPNSTGKFLLTVMDNGDNRVFAAGLTCGAAGSPPCEYSSALLLQIDETYKIATIVSRYLPGEFSFFGGNAEVLANGNIEADFNAGAANGFSDIFEVIPGSAPQVVWQLLTSGQYAYRGFRQSSLYPGVQW